ncbi:hypothetical protein ACWGS5_05080 [Streptomyces albidoflavus]|nr:MULTISPECIES: hypothetical protein [Streptomyces]MCR0988937.1 hypothetical protein [Streptomyces albidoflavus]MDH6188484.1 hypothetical protein [Streptomyces sp. CZ24]UYX93569.1 hypothetical protein OIM89_07350 [Streptomyces sp. BI87]WTC01650.1 hypothetical protein OG794_07345 [Streptomyces albidoflavus]
MAGAGTGGPAPAAAMTEAPLLAPYEGRGGAAWAGWLLPPGSW